MICNWKQHFDIQRFAAAGTQTTGTSTLSAEMKTFYDKTLLDNAEPQLVHDQFGQERNIRRTAARRSSSANFRAWRRPRPP